MLLQTELIVTVSLFFIKIYVSIVLLDFSQLYYFRSAGSLAWTEKISEYGHLDI